MSKSKTPAWQIVAVVAAVLAIAALIVGQFIEIQTTDDGISDPVELPESLQD